MPGLTKKQRRMNRKHVLIALKEETGSLGGTAAAENVDAYCADPDRANTKTFAYVGGLTLNKFYIDPAKPNASERRSLWMNVVGKMGKTGTIDPGNWDGSADVKKLQAILEGAK